MTHKIVDQYTIGLEDRGGFTFVIVNFLFQDQSTDSFEFHPAFAHQLSDELLKAVAHAVPRTNQSPEPKETDL